MAVKGETNLFDYLLWRGDLTFAQAPFCPVDNLIFSCLAYLNWNGIADGKFPRQAVTLETAASIWEAMPASWKQGEEKHAQLLHAAAGCERFRSVRLFHYAERFSEERQQQFSATTFLLDADDKTVYVAFRGTDNTLVGWREDFNMSFQSEVPSQTDAAAYLREILTMGFSNVLVGGHSKGGNLAVFSAVHAPRHMVQRIQAVYNNDGPGFANHLLETASFWYLKDRIHTFVPQDSVIGMLLEHDEDYQVVYSRQKGLQQHNPFSWCVLGNDFCYVRDISSTSRILDNSLREWIMDMTPDEREQLTDILFQLLNRTDAKTVRELAAGGPGTIFQMIQAFGGMSASQRGMMTMHLAELVQKIFSSTAGYSTLPPGKPNRLLEQHR